LCLLEIDPVDTFGILRAFVFDGRLDLHRMQMPNRRLDSSHRVCAGFVDDPGFLCLPDEIGHSRQLNGPELVVGTSGDPLQVSLQMVCESGGFGGGRRQFGRPKPACHPGGAIDRRAEGRNRQ
jgi:hypothetical protein